MKKITEINWDIFKVKFSGKEQKSFERLCYLLFCKEFKQNIGIPGYKNHAGIETDPIKINGENIGWQAKFYDTRLSEHKKDFVASIDTTKDRHPEINKIIFYTNQNFGQGKTKNDPQYKTDIEKHAKSKNVEIEWRTDNYFRSSFVCEENADIAQHFFSIDKSIIDFIGELIQHTESILTPINSKIKFKNDEIKIDRSQVIENLKAILNKSLMAILSGEAGVGKTAVIKDFYEQIKEVTPFFVFKAIEFNIPNINQLFTNYGHFTLFDFIKEHQDIDEKYIVIDSAEKLSDVECREIFQEFLSALINNNWKIIFTTRYSYLDDLKFQFIEVYHFNFQLINIEKLDIAEVTELSKKYDFNLPTNERLLGLLKIPFYLNEYLQNYQSINKTIDYSTFRDLLWNKQMLKSSYRENNIHIKRGECFLIIAKKRADEGQLFVKIDDCDGAVLQALELDEIIQYDSNAGGYFITHDVYEEWALEKIIEREFIKSEDYKSFFDAIGSSLPIRRAFRSWLSEKLFNNQNEVKFLIEESIPDNEIKSFWKDEILVSVLLSDYSETFFQLFENKLLEENQQLLMRIIFLLRIACKEIDEDFLKLLGLQKTEGITLKTLFTKPKGNGWNCVISFIHKHKEVIGFYNIYVILPLLDDWNSKNKEGETTKKTSQIALYYYEEIQKNGGFLHYNDDKKGQLIRVILQGASEIKEELKNIFDEVISTNQTNYRDKYYELIKTILTSITDNFEVIKCLPNYVIKLADLFWFQAPRKEGRYFDARVGVEKYFCLSERVDFDYFPSSALQTSIFQLLRFAPKETIDFILSFTDKTVECYAKSELKNEVEEVEVFINKKKNIKQYISNRLWNMYRGTQTSTSLLESIHMALEKWLLEYAKITSPEGLENTCKYLVENSKSASIAAVVVSVILAQPYKLFNVAKILFQTKEFFLYDASRHLLEQDAKSLYSMGYGLNFQHKIYQNERIKTCEDAHRKFSLEHIALQYQLFRTEEETESNAGKRQKIIWKIFDKYYKELPNKSKETKSDKTWRLYLARMDRRKMSPEIEEKDGQTLIKFNPKIDSELKKYSEDSLQKIFDEMKYTSLRLWTIFRFEKNEDKYKQYQQYENDPRLVITETKEIIDGLKKKDKDNFFLFNHSIPAYACSVLMRDFFDKLNSEEREFCKEVIIDFASIPLKAENYHYQISDGTEPSVFILPLLIMHFLSVKEEIKSLLLLLLFNPWREISTFAVRGVLQDLWKINFGDAHSIFLGYLRLAPKYNKLREKIRKENYKNNIYDLSEDQVIKRFINQYGQEINKIVSNKIAYKDVGKVEQLSLEVSNTAFELLPLKTDNEDHRKFITQIFPIFSKKLLIDDDKIDYSTKHRFLEKFAYFVLTSSREEIETYLKPFVYNFNNSREMANFFQEFIFVEDRLNRYEEFWIVWNAFYGKIVDLCKDSKSRYYANEIIHNYLLAGQYWEKDAKEWHTLKEKEKLFYKKVAQDIGHYPAVLYSISKILNDIGSNFLENGIFWISDILQRNKNLFSEELERNTIFYIENIVRRYILTNRQKIKKILKIKKDIVTILNFLIERGSVTGYLLREDIL
ncbi:ATPase [Candidatus Atribacteria bacterium HGW-Atribacteria-1]|nr:MAG: ATPase [Candidatus Atribacteria bacterium HGW-Atribacteria-1]